MVEVVTGLHSVSIHITDIHKARLFFRDVLGLKEISFDEKGNRAVFAIPGSSAPLSMHIMGPTEEGRPAVQFPASRSNTRTPGRPVRSSSAVVEPSPSNRRTSTFPVENSREPSSQTLMGMSS